MVVRWDSVPPEVGELGRWLREAHAATRLTYARLGTKINYHGSTVWRACSGRTVPRWELVAKIVCQCGADGDKAYELWQRAATAQQAWRAREISGWPPVQIIGTFDDLSRALRHLWKVSGRSQRAIADADETGQLRRSTMSAVLRGCRTPTRGFTEELVRACGGDERSVEAWVEVWDRLDAARATIPVRPFQTAYVRSQRAWQRRRQRWAEYHARTRHLA